MFLSKPRLARFVADKEDRKTVIHDLTAMLFNSFRVSNIDKIKSLMEFAKTEPQETAAFSPRDIALVEHTIGKLEQAKDDLKALTAAESEYRSTITASGGTDTKYNTLASFLRGRMAKVFSPVQDNASFLSDFKEQCGKQRVGSPLKDSPNSRLATKLGISPTDTEEQYAAKIRLGEAALILGKYAEKGMESDVHRDLLIDDSRDNLTKEVLEEIRDKLDEIVRGEYDENNPAAPEYDQCLSIVQEMRDKGFYIKGKGGRTEKNPLIGKLINALGGIIGTKPRKAAAIDDSVVQHNSPSVSDAWAAWEARYGDYGYGTGRNKKKQIKELLDALSEASPLSEQDLVGTSRPARVVERSYTPEERAIIRKIKAAKPSKGKSVAQIRDELWKKLDEIHNRSYVGISNAYDVFSAALEKNTSQKKSKKKLGKQKKGEVWRLYRGKYRLESVGKGSRASHGLIGDMALSREIDVPMITVYADELIRMTVMRLVYDDALSKAMESYKNAVADIDKLNLPDDVKEEFLTLPQRLFSEDRMKHVRSAVQNTDRLRKFMMRYDLSKVFGSAEGGLNAPMVHEMLQIAGILPSQEYDSSDAYISSDDQNPNSLVGLVSSLPDTRKEARDIIIQEPELIKSLLGSFDTGGNEEDQRKLNELLASDDYRTRSELRSIYDPQSHDLNERMLRYAKVLEDYDPAVGFTPEQEEVLSDSGRPFKAFLRSWGNDYKNTRGWREYYEQQKNAGKTGNVIWESFAPDRRLIPSLLNDIYKYFEQKNPMSGVGDVIDRGAYDRLVASYPDLDPSVISDFIDAPEISHFSDPAWATNKYTAKLNDYASGGDDLLAEDRLADPTGTDLVMTYKAFSEQNIPIKARVLLDRFLMNKDGDAVPGEVSVTSV